MAQCKIKIHQIDAFTNELFKGNPAGVCLLNEEIDDLIMQMIAREMNLSETAFAIKKADGFKIRFFTPKVERPICGHATLAIAHLLYSDGIVKTSDPIKFYTQLSDLVVKNERDWMKMDFPIDK